MSIELFKDLLQQAFGPALVFPFLTTKDARELRRVCRDFLGIVAAFRWHDMRTRVEKLALWRRCFPNATACLISVWANVDGLVHGSFEGIKWVECLRWSEWYSSEYPSLFASAETLHIDKMHASVDGVRRVDPRCLLRVRDLTIRCNLNDEHLKHLAGVRKLKVSGYYFSFTDAGLNMLDRVESLSLHRLVNYSMDPLVPTLVPTLGPPLVPPAFTDAALAGLRSLTNLCLDGVHCTFTAAKLALLPLCSLDLKSVDMVICAGQLAALRNLSFLCVSHCPNVELGDEDILEMSDLTQLVLDSCPAQITSGGLCQLVKMQLAHGKKLKVLKSPYEFEFKDRRPEDDYGGYGELWPATWPWSLTLYPKKMREKVMADRQAILGDVDGNINYWGSSLEIQTALEKVAVCCLFQISIVDCPLVSFTLEEYRWLISPVLFVGIESWLITGFEEDDNDEDEENGEDGEDSEDDVNSVDYGDEVEHEVEK